MAGWVHRRGACAAAESRTFALDRGSAPPAPPLPGEPGGQYAGGGASPRTPSARARSGQGVTRLLCAVKSRISHIS